MRRRDFIKVVASSVATWPLAARAQQPARLRTVGYLGSGTAAVQSRFALAFAQRLRELGWIEGHTLAIEYRWGEGRNDRFNAYAAEFVRLGVDVIATSGSAPVLAAKQATTTIPIVFAANSDPVGSGLVESFNRPGGQCHRHIGAIGRHPRKGDRIPAPISARVAAARDHCQCR